MTDKREEKVVYVPDRRQIAESTDPESQKRILKEAFKEALSERLQEVAAIFGKWSLQVLVTLAAGAVLWVTLSSHGWKP